MPKYLFSYHGGDFPPELEEKIGVAWKKWMDSLGAKGIDRGGPLMPGKTVSAGGRVTENGGPNPATGYSVIEAESYDAAIEIARACPQIGPPHKDGTIEISELIVM